MTRCTSIALLSRHTAEEAIKLVYAKNCEENTASGRRTLNKPVGKKVIHSSARPLHMTSDHGDRFPVDPIIEGSTDTPGTLSIAPLPRFIRILLRPRQQVA